MAEIELNGSPLGTTNNMFIRYKYNIKDSLKVLERHINDLILVSLGHRHF